MMKLKPCPFCECVDDWVSVEDKLPNARQAVLICVADGGIYKAVLLPYAALPCAHWQEMSDANRYFEDDFVTHWRPLPEPPQKKQPKDKIIKDLIVVIRATLFDIKKLCEALEAMAAAEMQ